MTGGFLDRAPRAGDRVQVEYDAEYLSRARGKHDVRITVGEHTDYWATVPDDAVVRVYAPDLPKVGDPLPTDQVLPDGSVIEWEDGSVGVKRAGVWCAAYPGVPGTVFNPHAAGTPWTVVRVGPAKTAAAKPDWPAVGNKQRSDMDLPPGTVLADGSMAAIRASDGQWFMTNTRGPVTRQQVDALPWTIMHLGPEMVGYRPEVTG